MKLEIKDIPEDEVIDINEEDIITELDEINEEQINRRITRYH